MRRSLHGLSLLSFIALGGCGIESSLVEGRCAEGFQLSGKRCVKPLVAQVTEAPPPAASPDPSPATDAGSSVAADASRGGPDLLHPTLSEPIAPEVEGPAPSISCALPLVACHGACIPVGDDGTNCGACGKLCPSNICVAGECVGATPGDVVLIGHDFATARTGTAQSKVLVNAMSIPTTDPIRVLSFEDGAPTDSVAQVKWLTAAGISGRQVSFTRAESASTLESTTLHLSYDIVLLHDASSGDPVAVGTGWSRSLGTFTAKGGVVIALDNASSPMPALLTSAGLLAVARHTQLPESTHLFVAAAGDVVGAQVLSPYATNGAPVSFQGIGPVSPDLSWVVRLQEASGPGDPVVVHRVVR